MNEPATGIGRIATGIGRIIADTENLSREHAGIEDTLRKILKNSERIKKYTGITLAIRATVFVMLIWYFWKVSSVLYGGS